MAKSDIRPSFSAGELSPGLWGRTDLAKFRIGMSVARNGFVSYRGGWASRAGTAFVGQCLQAASIDSLPPRLVRFQYNIAQSYMLEFGNGYMRVVANGAYVTETPITITGVSQGYPCVLTVPGNGFAPGDWIYLSGIGGAVELDGRTVLVATVNGAEVTLDDPLSDQPLDSRGYGAFTAGGAAARIYTLSTPYQSADLPYLKYVQSADVMSLTCVNQSTGAEYPPYDLKRLAANNWSLDEVSFAASIAAPPSCSVSVSSTTSGTAITNYAYCVTAIDGATGQESIASPVAFTVNSVDIALTAGSHAISWQPVAGASGYNIYATAGSYDEPVPTGSSFGYLGTTQGTAFVNSNILPDFTKSPPQHINPFARSTILYAVMTANGASYGQTTTTATVGGGTGASLTPVVSNGAITAVIVQDGGEGYATGAPITFTDTSGAGSGASGTIVAGPASGTFPGVVAYFQQRRFYASTLNNPDTYFASQTGAYTNFDASTPPVDSDAITGTPWGQQVNGVQWLQPMPGGLIAATGQDAWQISGTAGAGSPVTPSQQAAQPQESNGFSPTVPIIKVGFDLLYLSSFATAVYDLQYNFFTNIYSGTDISVLSNHLFDGFALTHWAYAKQPFKVVWAARSDGKFLSLTFLKEQELTAWCRHDTNGLVCGVEVASELPVDAPYLLVKRYIAGAKRWAYYVERMDNRAWDTAEDAWCVDCGLALPQPAPNATLSAAAALGPGTISGGYIAAAGQGYTKPVASLVDPTGQGAGGAISLQVNNGAIVGFTISSPGKGYSLGTTVSIADPTGGGATFVPLVSQSVLFIASAPVFSATQPGDVIRMGGGMASVETVSSATQLMATILTPILATMPNDPNGLPVPAGPGDWTITTPVSTIYNLEHLEGMQVSVLADGAVVAGGDEPLLTVTNGSITLPDPASSITVGLPFVAQMQSMHAEPVGEPTIQGKRKNISGVTLRMEKTRGAEIGTNQPVASRLPYQQEKPWTNMRPMGDIAIDGVPSAALPLYTGDRHLAVGSDWQGPDGNEAAPGMVCVQQRNPLPVTVLALVEELEVGDSDG